MVAHTEPVKSWGHKPCGKFASRLTPVSRAGGGAPRPPGTGRGNPEVKTLLYSASDSATGGRRTSAGLAERNTQNEQLSSQAAAPLRPPISLSSSYEGGDHGRARNLLGGTIVSLVGLGGDLGTACHD